MLNCGKWQALLYLRGILSSNVWLWSLKQRNSFPVLLLKDLQVLTFCPYDKLSNIFDHYFTDSVSIIKHNRLKVFRRKISVNLVNHVKSYINLLELSIECWNVNLLKLTGYVMHHQFNIQQLYALPTLYLCVLYLSENKQRLVPLTA